MNIKNIVNSDLVNLVNCESEPIHIPGSIQPHGFLLAVNEASSLVDYCSENVKDFLHLAPAQVLGKSLSTVIGAGEAANFSAYLITQKTDHSHPFVFSAGKISFNTTLHKSGDHIIFEAEPFPDGSVSLPDLYRQTERFVSHMEGAGSLAGLCKSIADETRMITGYDRVMVYRFDASYNGEVIAESKREDIISFAGQKYPHTDIPAQARELYIRNQLRVITDVNYIPVPLLTINDESNKTNKSLDLSISVLRSVSPIHIEYLKNMGVGATLTVSLLLNKKLWGLIACHHYSPKILPHFTRLSALLQGHFLTSQIAVREAAEEFEISVRCDVTLAKLFELLGENTDFIKEHFKSKLLGELANANGTIIFHSEKLYCSGITPAAPDAQLLVDLLLKKYRHTGFISSSISEVFPETMHMAETVSGVIYYPVSNLNEDCIIWLRPQILETIKWGGNPYKNLDPDDTLSRLTPRKSFELWTEEVKNKSSEWKKSEVHAAESFAYALEKNLVLNIARQQEERYRNLNEELKDANKELANINWISTHDLKEPLRKIRMFASMMLDNENEILPDKIKNSVTRMRSAAERMQALIDDILSYSRTGNTVTAFTEVDMQKKLQEILDELKEDIDEKHAIVTIGKMPVIKVIPFQVKQLFINLMNNALKFSENDTSPQIRINCMQVSGDDINHSKSRRDENYYCITVADNGIGFEQQYTSKIFDVFQRLHLDREYTGTGIGLAICKKIMENHKGFIDASSAPGKGTTMFLYFPEKMPE